MNHMLSKQTPDDYIIICIVAEVKLKLEKKEVQYKDLKKVVNELENKLKVYEGDVSEDG